MRATLEMSGACAAVQMNTKDLCLPRGGPQTQFGAARKKFGQKPAVGCPFTSDELMSKSKHSVATGPPAPSSLPAGQIGKAFPPEAQPHRRWKTVAVCLFLAAMVWAVFGQTLHYEFINYDDPVYVYRNPTITQGLSRHGIVWVFTHDNGLGEWFPLTDLSHMLVWQLSGSNASGHHLTNVLLHAATAILLFLALQKMTGVFWPAAFVAAVFAIHPLRVESVAWVVERKDVLSGLFFTLTLWAWARYAQKRPGIENQGSQPGSLSFTPGPRRWPLDYFLALAFFALGLLSKSILVTLPFVLLLLDYWPLNRLASGATYTPHRLFRAGLGLFLEKIPFLLLSAAACVATALTQKNAIGVAQSHTCLWRVGNAMLAYTDYLKHMFYPVGLALLYPRPGTNLPLWKVGLSVLLLLIISAGVTVGRRKHPYLLVGWLWYLGMLLPVIDIMQAGDQARADRYTYLPQIGLYILITWGAVELCNSWRSGRVVLGFGAVAILGGLLVGARVQTSFWKNSVSIWSHTLACLPENSLAHNNLGNALVARENWAEAVQHFERALQIKPDYAQAHLNLGVALANQGKREEAIQHFKRALQINPDSADALYNLGNALAAEGKPAEAIQHLKRALQLKPDYSLAHYDLGNVLATQGKWEEAIGQYEQALHRKLDYSDAQYILGVALATQRKWEEAIELYRRVIQAKPGFAEARYNFGIALASRGKSAEALRQFQQALLLATAQGNTALAESIRARLKSGQSPLPQLPTP
jgi:tetratricopeptide (TPR) repeat protein